MHKDAAIPIAKLHPRNKYDEALRRAERTLVHLTVTQWHTAHDIYQLHNTRYWRPSDDEQLNTQLAGYISYIKLEMQNKGINESHIGKLNGCGATDIAINWLRTRRRYKQQGLNFCQ